LRKPLHYKNKSKFASESIVRKGAKQLFQACKTKKASGGMKSHIYSINDIARELGVSPSTVSRALKDHPDISPETIRQVKAFAQKVNYRPNVLALSLRSRRSNTIGLIIPEIAHHFFSSVISGIEELAYGRSYRMMICQSSEDQAREAINLQALIDHRVDGILVSVSKNTMDYEPFRKALDTNIPIVFFDRISDDLPTDRVITDDFEGARAITRHLLQRGRHRLLHLAAPKHLLVGKERYRGFLQALSDFNIDCKSAQTLQCDTREEVLQKKDELLKLAPQIDAIFAVNDFTAIAAMQLLQENGFNIPGDIAIAGFGNDPIASIVNPALTTIEQKGFDMGKECARLLIERIENPDKDIFPRTRVFEGSLVVRNST
jgi:DNA-binding LacI/PurR family transcriptional regulator